MLLRIAWRNVGRNKRRTALTLAAAVFAVILVVHMIALTTGVHARMIEDNVRMHAGHLQVTGAGYLDDRTLERFVEWTPRLAAAVDATPGVRAAAPRLDGFALLANGDASQGVALIGVDPEREARVSTWPRRIARGEFLTPRETRPPPGPRVREILLGEPLAEALGVDLGDRVVALSVAYTLENASDFFTVQGILHVPDETLGRSLALISLFDAQEFFVYDDRVSEVALLATDPDSLAQTRAEVAARLAPLSPEPLDVNDWPRVMPDLAQLIAIDDIQNYSMLAILVVVVGFVLLLTILMSVLERQRELGVLLALGLAPRAIFRLVYLESLLLSGVGLGLGLAIALPAAAVMVRNPIRMTGAAAEMSAQFGMEPVIAWQLDASNPLVTAGLMVALALLAALYPAAKAASAKPVDALRSL